MDACLRSVAQKFSRSTAFETYNRADVDVERPPLSASLHSLMQGASDTAT
jgi:hypothetical protein